MQISFTPEFAGRLRGDLVTRGVLGPEVLASGTEDHNPLGGGNTYELERAIDGDLILTSVGWANSIFQGRERHTDEWGVTWQGQPYETPFGTGTYPEMVGYPLADDKAIAGYVPPDPTRPELYLDSERVVRDFREEYWVVGVAQCTIWETAWALRGLEQRPWIYWLTQTLREEDPGPPIPLSLGCRRAVDQDGRRHAVAGR